ERLQPDWNGASLMPEELAAELQNKIPWIIGWKHLVPVAYRAKCQFNENSKILASSSQIPEIHHNEIEGTLSCRNHSISPVFLRSREEDDKTRIGFESAAAIFEENGCHPEHLNLRFNSRIEEALGFTMYLDMVSVRLAEILGVDPVSVERIAQLKRRLKG
ncbi:MAG: SIS domain-containing protein, partial [Candidatus Thorarchaeota archaeon]